MSLLFRLLSLFSPGLNFIWIKKTMWTGAESEMSCSLFSTSSEVLGKWLPAEIRALQECV